MYKNRRIAIVYDWFDSWGGVERMLLEMRDIFPEAHFYTSYVNYKTAPWAKDFSLRTSFLQNFPGFIKNSRVLSLLFYPYVFESFQLSHYDVVISVSSSFAKGIIVKPGTSHIAIILTPTRYAWFSAQHYKNNPLVKIFYNFFANKLLKWDFIAAQRPDVLIAISEIVKARIEKYYRRNSTVIYPPFDPEYWIDLEQQKPSYFPYDEYYLVVSRLEPYKKIDLAIEAFRHFPDKKLIIVGQGTEYDRLKSLRSNSCIFLEHCSDNELAWLYAHARALIMPQEEDFGYVSLEAQALQCPVIAYKKGGAVETVVEEKTGIFFNDQTIFSLRDAVERFHTLSYNGKKLTEKIVHNHLKKFGKDTFREKLLKIINTTNV